MRPMELPLRRAAAVLPEALRRHDRVLAPLLGIASVYGFAPYGAWPLTLLALAALFALGASATPRRAALLGWLFGAGMFGRGVWWVYISTHVYGGAPAWLGALLCVALCSYLALYPALVLGLASRWQLWRSRAGWIAVPGLWLAAELLRGWVYSGFPWLSLGYVALDWPAERLAPLIGVHGVSAVLAASAYAIARGLAPATAPSARLLALLLAASPLAAAALPPPTHWSTDTGRRLSVAIVQGNFSQDVKWLPGTSEEILRRYWDMTQAVLGVDLIVWPEAVPNAPYDMVQGYLEAVATDARAAGSTVLGGVLIRPSDREIYNSMLAMGAAEGRYDKQHLVPFGEYFPIPDWLRPLMDVLGTPYSDFSSGRSDLRPIVVQGARLGVSICFEDVFGSELARASRDASLLVNASNDAWFARSVAPEQHLQIARMRALENGRWLVRATNTGVSALIAADGHVMQRSGLFTTETLRGEVPLREGSTPYARLGDAPLWGASGLVLALAWFATWRRRGRR